ncbi:MAG: cytochrome c3 family protein [bacterium]
MKHYKNCIMLFIAILLWTGHAVFSVQENDSKTIEEFAEKKGGPNPHNDMNCTDCHKTKPGKGDTREIVTFTKATEDLCVECHGAESNIHPSGVAPSMKIPSHLPLTAGKKVDCITCHDVHAKDIKYVLLRGFESGKYKWRTDMCYDCHGMEFLKKNPHRMTADGERKCNYCHITEPKVSDTKKTIGFRINVLTLCNFCHNVTAKNHPMNVDTTVLLPASLPRGADGEITCGTCHDPHGTHATIHYLRPEYVYSLEEGKYVKPHFDETQCLLCHITLPKEGANADEVDYRYGGNFTLLCNSCHGTESNMHPVDILPPPEMKIAPELPLRKGKITCQTCHNAGFVNKTSLYLLRGLEEGGKNKDINDLCFMCHDKEEFQKLNPHLEMKAKRKCMYCHIVPPDSGDKDSEEDSKGLKVEVKMLCIRCHSHRAHPASYSHVVRPTMIVPKGFPLALTGEITCTTCHDPHSEGARVIKTKRLRKGFACNLCHLV